MQRRPNNINHTSVRFSDEVKAKIEEDAERLNIPTAEWIRRACAEKLERDEQKRKSLAEQKAAYIDGKLIEAIKYALTLPEVQKMIREILGGDKE